MKKNYVIGQQSELTSAQSIGVFLDARVLLLSCATRRHFCMPIGCRVADSLHDFLDPWPSRFVAAPTLLHELPQWVQDPDILRIRWFIWPDARYNVVRELLGLDILKRIISRKDLTECQETRREGDSTITWSITSPKAYMSASWVGILLSRPNLEGASCSGAMNVVVPPPNAILHDSGFCGSSTIVVNPKSARQA